VGRGRYIINLKEEDDMEGMGFNHDQQERTKEGTAACLLSSILKKECQANPPQLSCVREPTPETLLHWWHCLSLGIVSHHPPLLPFFKVPPSLLQPQYNRKLAPS